MRPRILVLSVLDSLGQRGLAADVRSAVELGVDAIPISTGAISGAAPTRVIATRPRLLAAALQSALEHPVDGMLLGPVYGYWQSRVVARALSVAIPETLVLAPVPDERIPLPGGRAWRTVRQAALPTTTVAVLPQRQAGDLLGLRSDDDDPYRVATEALDAGAHAAWLTADDNGRRVVDVIAMHGHKSVIDYPPTDSGTASPGAALAALLALGLTLREAIDHAHRNARGLGDRRYIAEAR